MAEGNGTEDGRNGDAVRRGQSPGQWRRGPQTYVATPRWSSGIAVAGSVVYIIASASARTSSRGFPKVPMPRLLQTTIAGSLPKPSWLAPPNQLWAPWLLEGEQLAEAKRDAVRLAVREQERSGIDIVTDGEQTRRHFVTTLIENL